MYQDRMLWRGSEEIDGYKNKARKNNNQRAVNVSSKHIIMLIWWVTNACIKNQLDRCQEFIQRHLRMLSNGKCFMSKCLEVGNWLAYAWKEWKYSQKNIIVTCYHGLSPVMNKGIHQETIVNYPFVSYAILEVQKSHFTECKYKWNPCCVTMEWRVKLK